MRPHLSMNVSNLAKSIEFYSRVFGVKPQKQTAEYAKFDLQEPLFNFSLHQSSENRLPSRVNHLGIEVMDLKYVAEWKKKLEEQNITVITEEDTDCCYAKQDKVWFQDPDKNSWEVFFVHEQLPTGGAEPSQVKAAKSCSPASGCC